MKKMILGLLISGAALITTPTHAQLQKGNLMIGADLANIELNLQSGNTKFGFDLNPKLGYFVDDNIAVGGMLNIGIESSKGYFDFEYGIGAFGRYYVSDPRTILLKHARFFAEAGVGINGYNTRTETVAGTVSTSTNGLGISAGPGVAYFLSPNISLEALLKYDLAVGFGNSTTNNKFSVNVGFQIYLPTNKARAIYNEVKRETGSTRE